MLRPERARTPPRRFPRPEWKRPTTPGDHIVAGVPITSHRLPDAIAEQLVTFEGNGETVTIRHETLSRDSYDSGIAAAIRFAATSAGVTVGLDRVMGIQ
jgi:4-hydroxy-tetrahydrodipicolinate reductase